MYCSTCGARVPAGRSACDTCGARIGYTTRTMASRAPLAEPVARAAYPAPMVGVCPRCSYRGEGVGYFSRGSHVAGLVVATMFTSWAMGAGGLVYFLLRREHRICPRCGESWGPRNSYPLVPASAHDAAPASVPAGAALAAAEPAGSGWALLLFLLAAVLTVGAIVGGNPGALGFAAVSAGAGIAVHRVSTSRREARRAALLSSLQLPVLRLAAERGGRLTVTEVAAGLGWTIPRSEKVLESLEDGYRVSSEVTDDGVIVYEFLELLHAPGRGELPA